MKKICLVAALLLAALVPASQAQTAADKSVDIDYDCTDVTSSLGVSQVMPLSAAIYIPAERAAAYAGCSVTAVSFGLSAESQDVSVFVAEELNAPLTTQTVGNGAYGWNEVTLDAPYVIGDRGFYVGYTATGLKQLGVSTAYDDNACYVAVNGQWANYATTQGFNALCLRFTVTGSPALPDLALRSLAVEPARTGEPFTVRCAVRNFSPDVVTGVSFDYALDGGATQTVEAAAQIAPSATDTVELTLPAFDAERTASGTLTLAAANGLADAYAANNAQPLALESRDLIFYRPMVVEEGTSIRCGWCPRGIVALREMKARYPDTFLPIAIHLNTLGTDPLTPDTYEDIETRFFSSGLPNCVIGRDRDLVMSPSTEALQAAYDNYSFVADAGVELKAAFGRDDANRTTVTFDAATTFAASHENANYRLAFVVIENAVKGYTQTNYFAGGGQGEMGGFENLPAQTDVVLDEVAHGIWQTFTGTLRSIPTTIEKGETYTYSYTTLLPAAVQDSTHLEAVALLIDVRTGHIVNACKAPLGSDPTGISNATATPAWRLTARDGRIVADGSYDTLQVFTTDGRLVRNEGLAPGTYLVRLVKGRHTAVSKLLVR